MRAGTQPGALDQRHGGQGGATDDVGRTRGGFQVGGGLGIKALFTQAVGQCLGAGLAHIPHHHTLDRPHGTHGLRNQARDTARAHDQQRARILARQIVRAQRGRARRAVDGDDVTIHLRNRNARLGAVQVVRGVQAGQALVRVLGKDVDDLHAEVTPVAPGRHDQRGAMGSARLNGVDMPRGHSRALAESLAQGGNDGVE
ncbi:hypothetical protein D3C86_1318410 [compost metagenome]